VARRALLSVPSTRGGPASCSEALPEYASSRTRKPSSSNMAATPWAPKRSQGVRRDIVVLEQTHQPGGGHGGARRSRQCCSGSAIKSGIFRRPEITDAAPIEIVETVLAGSINKQIVSYINEAGGKAVGLCARPANMVRVEGAANHGRPG